MGAVEGSLCIQEDSTLFSLGSCSNMGPNMMCSWRRLPKFRCLPFPLVTVMLVKWLNLSELECAIYRMDMIMPPSLVRQEIMQEKYWASSGFPSWIQILIASVELPEHPKSHLSAMPLKQSRVSIWRHICLPYPLDRAGSWGPASTLHKHFLRWAEETQEALQCACIQMTCQSKHSRGCIYNFNVNWLWRLCRGAWI